ncbi:MAG: DUF952 domain-containing protein [Actinomycetota bacterium]
MTIHIFHLAEPADWARSTDTYSPPSVDEEGFVHCSTADQLPVVARERYLDHNRLILLTIDPDQLDLEALVYEDLYGEGEEFPHVYGPLPTSAVVSTGPYLAHLEEGMWRDTRFNRDWMDRMLHPDFAEVGMSGSTYTREGIIEASRPRQCEAHLPLEDYRLELIDEDVAMPRYVSHDTTDGVERRAHRTSLWVNTNEGWRLRFHQGTPLP